ncbi:MAG: hypothetical protein FWF60_06395 [Oscillospiraceae bacterium]|nr:hypothetical protein [Oscillospiraceae bacterium]
MTKTLVLAANAGAYCYPFANSARIRVLPPEHGMQAARFFDKVILINGVAERWLYDPALEGKDSYYFLWDPARCPHYAPCRATLARLKTRHKVYSFQREDCEELGLHFNSTMYAPPPPGLLPPAPEILYDVLFLGVPKDRLPLLRRLYGQFTAQGLRVKFQIGLAGDEGISPEEAVGWRVTREWVPYLWYLRWVRQSRAILDIYQAIQTGFSLRVMEHIFFGKKLVTDNAVIKQAEFYHPNNIFLLREDDINALPGWLDLPFVPAAESVKAYYKFENWVERFV